MQDLMQQTIMGKSVCNFRRKGDLLEVNKSKRLCRIADVFVEPKLRQLPKKPN